MEKETILVVDDEQIILDVLLRNLQVDGYRVITALNGEEGLAKLKRNEVDLVISDQKMPGMSGVEFLRQVKMDYPGILTIMLTGYADVETAMDAINLSGVYKFLMKPINADELRIHVKRALEARQVVMERDALMEKVKGHEAKLKELERRHPGLTMVERDKDGNVILDLDKENT